MKNMHSNDRPIPYKKDTMTTTPKPEIQTEDFGNGIIIKWKIYK